MPQTTFADTLAGKIIIGVAVAAGSSLISWVVSRATYVPPPLPLPVAEIVPQTLAVEANTFVEFSATGSSSPSASELSYRWLVSGLPPNHSSVARCSENGATLRCRFALPGTFAVSLEVVDANGQTDTASSTITVDVSGGYLALNLSLDDPDAHRALLYDVDWLRLQSFVTRPIVLYDPDTDGPIYAMHTEIPVGTPDPAPWLLTVHTIL